MNITLKKQRDFDPAAFLAKAGLGREIVHQLVNNRQPNILTKQIFPVIQATADCGILGECVGDPETEPRDYFRIARHPPAIGGRG